MKVASVELQKNGVTITSDKVEVNKGVPTTLGCNIIPSTSRPPPTVIWYIGSSVKQTSASTNYTVTATETDHDKIFYCKAYNRPWNQPVESAKPKLLVRGKVEINIYRRAIVKSVLVSLQILIFKMDYYTPGIHSFQLSFCMFIRLLAHLSPWSVRLSALPHFQTYPLKPLGQLNSNFIWRLLRTWE